MEKEAVMKWVQDIQTINCDPEVTYRGYLNPDTHTISSKPSSLSSDHMCLDLQYMTDTNQYVDRTQTLGSTKAPNAVQLLKDRPQPIQFIKSLHVSNKTGPSKMHLGRRQVPADDVKRTVDALPLCMPFSGNSVESPLPHSNPDIVLPTITLSGKESMIPRRKPLIKRSVSGAHEFQHRPQLQSKILRSCTFLDIHQESSPKSAPVSPQLQNRKITASKSLRECNSHDDVMYHQMDNKQDDTEISLGLELATSNRSDVAEKHSLSQHSSDDFEMPANAWHSESAKNMDVISDVDVHSSTTSPPLNVIHQEPSLPSASWNLDKAKFEDDDTASDEEDREESKPDLINPDNNQGSPRVVEHKAEEGVNHEEELLEILKKWYYQGYSVKSDLVRALRITGHRKAADRLVVEEADNLQLHVDKPPVHDNSKSNEDLSTTSALKSTLKSHLTKQKAMERSPSPSDQPNPKSVGNDRTSPSVISTDKLALLEKTQTFTDKLALLEKTQTFSFDTSNEINVTHLPKQPKFLSTRSPLKRSSSVQQDINCSMTSSSSHSSHVTSHDAYINRRHLKSPTLEDYRRGSYPNNPGYAKSPNLQLRNEQMNSDDKAKQTSLLDKNSPDLVLQHNRASAGGKISKEQFAGRMQLIDLLSVGASPAAELAKGKLRSLQSNELQNKGGKNTKQCATRQDSGIGTLSLTSDKPKHTTLL